MEKLWTIILVAGLFHLATGVYVEQIEQNFTSARKICTLATPKLNFTATGPTVEFESVHGLHDGESAWIGYIQDYDIFQYLGCVMSSNIQRPANVSITIEKNIGQCHSFCKSYKYFVVKAHQHEGAECRCINVSNPQFTMDWLSSCDNSNSGDEFPFGDNSSLSIYRIVGKEADFKLRKSRRWEQANFRCVELYEPKSNTYGWRRCSDTQKVLCKSKINSTLWEPSIMDFLTWKEATQRCLENNTILIPFQNSPVINEQASPQYWTSNIRAYVISTVTDRTFSNSIQYGYIVRSNSEYFLRFEATSQSTQKRKALCDGSVTNISPSAAFTTTQDKPSNKPSSDSVTGSYMANTGNSEQENQNVAVFVAVPLVIIFLLVVGAIGGFFLWKRRKAKGSKDENNPYNECSTRPSKDNDVNGELRPNSTDDYNEICDIEESVNQDYDIIKDKTDSDPTRNSVSNHSYFVLEKTENGQFNTLDKGDYDFATEPETNYSTAQNDNHRVLETHLDTKIDQSNRDKNTGYDYAKVIPKDDVTNASLCNNFDNEIDKADTDTDYDHLDQDGTRDKEPKGLKRNIVGDDGNVYNKTNVNDSADNYDHINSGINGQRNSRSGSAMGFNALSRTYNKWIDISPDDSDTYNHANHINNGSFDDQTYNTTDVLRVKNSDSDHPYDHTN